MLFDLFCFSAFLPRQNSLENSKDTSSNIKNANSLIDEINPEAYFNIPSNLKNITFGQNKIELGIEGSGPITFSGIIKSGILLRQIEQSSQSFDIYFEDDPKEFTPIVCNLSKPTTISFSDEYWNQISFDDLIFVVLTPSDFTATGITGNMPIALQSYGNGSIKISTESTEYGLSSLSIRSEKENIISYNVLNLHELYLNDKSILSPGTGKINVDKSIHSPISYLSSLQITTEPLESIELGGIPDHTFDIEFKENVEAELLLYDMPNGSTLQLTNDNTMFTYGTNSATIKKCNLLSKVTLNGGKVTLNEFQSENIQLQFTNEIEVNCNMSMSMLSNIASNELGKVSFLPDSNIDISYRTDNVPLINLTETIIDESNHPSLIKLIHSGELEQFNSSISSNVFCVKSLKCESFESLLDVGELPFVNDSQIVFRRTCHETQNFTCLGFEAYIPEIETTSEISSEATTIVSSEATTVVSSEETTSEIKTEISSEITTEVSSEITTEISSEITTEVSSEITTEISSEIITEVSSEIITEISSEIITEVSSEIITEISSEVSSQQTQEEETSEEETTVDVTTQQTSEKSSVGSVAVYISVALILVVLIVSGIVVAFMCRRNKEDLKEINGIMLEDNVFDISTSEQRRLNPVDAPSYEQKESCLGYGIFTDVPSYSQQQQIVQEPPKEYSRTDLEYGV
ncbi:putative carbonic anhydrase-like protein 2 [Histomonas meleagridis]|uniref:putative carbonic anhydrase-like protein 2 n=1 Tax=Histomonas meleagridis TaxID=135588 RepID=UPI00355A0DFF|nr:putative carbonic anhydrase-like protein 2 [Histomonas meleagridis]KAH0802638.1 putative carbonic anhydrase-like protein 2 [Histomonas meleagridis]